MHRRKARLGMEVPVRLPLELESASAWVIMATVGGRFHERQHAKTLHPQQKAEIVAGHLAGKEAVSALADEFCVQPSQIRGWVNQVLAQSEAAFQRAAGAGGGERWCGRAQQRTATCLRAEVDFTDAG